MDNTLILVIAAAAGLIVGFIIAKVIEKSNASKVLASAKKSAATIVKEAKNEGETIKKDKILQAKEKFIELKAEHEKVILNRDKKISDVEKRTRDKESQVSSELARNKKLNAEVDNKRKQYEERLSILEKRQGEVEKLHFQPLPEVLYRPGWHKLYSHH